MGARKTIATRFLKSGGMSSDGKGGDGGSPRESGEGEKREPGDLRQSGKTKKQKPATSPSPRPRRIRSYVLREGRLTPAQRRALDQLWPRHGLSLPPAGGDTLDFAQVFHRTAPTRLEIGFGDGGALLEMAAQNPATNYLGAEVHRPGVGHLLLQLEAQGLTNVKIFCADGMEVLTRAIAPAALDAIYLYFPDPWPKKKHHKRRIMQPTFITLAAEKLTLGGQLHFATDWQPYAEEALERLEESAGFENQASPNCFTPRPADRPITKFERRGRKLGHGVWDVVMRRVGVITPPLRN